MIPTTSSLYPYQKKAWENFTLFAQDMNTNPTGEKTKNFFDGEGQLNNEYQGERHYLFSLNSRIFSSVLTKNTEEFFKFAGVVELDSQILKSAFFPRFSSTSYFNPLEASVQVDCKHYDYKTEHKLLISKADKVDLLFSQQLIESEEHHVINTQVYSSLKQAVEWQLKVNEINVRTARIVAEMKKR